MYCRQCGKMISVDSSFCQYCGTAVINAEDKSVVKYSIKITSNEAVVGVKKRIIFDGVDKALDICIPAKVKDGQILLLHRIKFNDSYGKKIKKDIQLKIIIDDEENE